MEVLKAIYDLDFQDLRLKDVWKVDRPPEFTLRLRPQHDSRGNLQENCSVLIKFKFGPNYPLEIPETIQVVFQLGFTGCFLYS